MNYREFGRTGLKVSEIGFGAWGIGGAYGAVDRRESLRALAIAEELGCNFVDTAAVYGDSESILGEFLRQRRHRWLIATKYSGQTEGIEHCVDQQLRRLGTDRIDLYQLHWTPREPELYERLERLRAAGKVRCVGVSLYNVNDIDFVLSRPGIDSIQLPFSLLDPEPFLARRDAIARAGVAVIVRSCLREGFLTGKYTASSRFDDPQDQRHGWSPRQIRKVVNRVEQFRFLEAADTPLLLGAARYPLAFAEVSTVILGTRNTRQVVVNFKDAPADRLSPEQLDAIRSAQQRLHLDREPTLLRRILEKLKFTSA